MLDTYKKKDFQIEGCQKESTTNNTCNQAVGYEKNENVRK